MEGEENNDKEETMKETANLSKEETTEEKMEEEAGTKTEEPEEVTMEEPEGEGEEDSSLLDPVAGEEEEGDVDDQDEEKLLRKEVSHEEEKSDEDKIGDFIGTDFSYKTENEKQKPFELNIDSPNDNSMSDDDNSTTKIKCQVEAHDSESYEIPEGSSYNSTKPDTGGTQIHQEESPEPVLSSKTATVYTEEEEDVMAGEEQGEGAEGGGGEEVVFVEEVKVGEGDMERRGTPGRRTGKVARTVEAT